MQRSQMKFFRRQELLLIAFVLGFFLAPFSSVRADVILEYFVGSPQGEGVLIEWETASKSNSDGFYLYRSIKPDSDFTRLNIFFLSDSQLGEGVFYSYLDEQVVPGYTYYYQLEAIDLDGSRDIFGPVRVNYQVQLARTPTATLGSGIITATPTLTATSTRGAVDQAQRTPTPSGLILLLPTETVTPSPTSTEAEATTPEPTQTPTLEPLPAFEFLFPAPTATQIASPPALSQQITSEPVLAAKPSAKPLSTRHIVLLIIISVLWIFLFVFIVFLVRNYLYHRGEAEEAD